MAGFLEARNAKIAAKTHGGRLSVDQTAQWPTVRQMLEGVVDPGGSQLIPQFRLTFWAADSGLDFAFFQKGAAKGVKSEAWFGSIGGAVDVLAAVELAMMRMEVAVKLEDGAKF